MKSMLRMTPRMKLMHEFAEYMHCYGWRKIELEEWVAKEKHRKARAKKIAISKKEIV